MKKEPELAQNGQNRTALSSPQAESAMLKIGFQSRTDDSPDDYPSKTNLSDEMRSSPVVISFGTKTKQCASSVQERILNESQGPNRVPFVFSDCADEQAQNGRKVTKPMQSTGKTSSCFH